MVAETVAGFDRTLEQLTMLISGRIDRLARSLDGYDRQLRLLSPSGRMDSQRQQLDRIEKQINELMADKIEDRSMRCDRLHRWGRKRAMVRKCTTNDKECPCGHDGENTWPFAYS